jgi:hypothetical protein
MLKFFPFVDQMHGAKLPHIVIYQAIAISHQELNMIVIFRFVFVVAPMIFSLHTKMGDNGEVLEFYNEIFTVSINLGESLVNDFGAEDGWGGVFDDARVKHLDQFYSFRFWVEKD